MTWYIAYLAVSIALFLIKFDGATPAMFLTAGMVV